MDMKKLVAMAVLVVVIVVAVVIVVKRTSNEAPPMTAEADKTLDMIDMKSLEVFSETPADWNGKYAADASGRHKNPKTGEYTIVEAMKCASCGQLIPRPEIPADQLPPAPPGMQKGFVRGGNRGGTSNYLQAKAMVMMKILRDYKCPRCGKNAWIGAGQGAASQ